MKKYFVTLLSVSQARNEMDQCLPTAPTLNYPTVDHRETKTPHHSIWLASPPEPHGLSSP